MIQITELLLTNSMQGAKGSVKAAKVVEKTTAKKHPMERQPIERLDIRVGKVLSVKNHPNANKMYVEQIDVGDSDGPREIVSGLREHVTIEEFEGTLVLVLCNLKPIKLRGIKSNGMVLCASNEDHSVVELLHPESIGGDVQAGDQVEIDGHNMSQPDARLAPKRKYWQTCQPYMTSRHNNGGPPACYKNVPLTVGETKVMFEPKSLLTYTIS